MKDRMTRREEIEFLCERMRLLNCFQSGQPGGINFKGSQFLEPSGLSRDAAWRGNGGKNGSHQSLSGTDRGAQLADDDEEIQSRTANAR